MKAALDQILGQIPIGEAAAGAEAGQQAPDLDQLIAMAEQLLADGDADRSAQAFMQIAQLDNSKPEPFSGLIRALLASGQKEQAQAAYDALPDELKQDPIIQQANSALELAGSNVDESELQALRAAAAERPADMDAQMAFAEAGFAAGARDEAADVLLKMIENDPEWNEGAAKAKLLQIFEAVGLEDPWVSSQRRRLSLLLFG